MTVENAKRIILHAVNQTQRRWKEYSTYWNDIDKVFISRGYEQGGFECFKFTPLLEQRNIFAIEELGSIPEPIKGGIQYNRAFAGSLTSPFYVGMKEGNYGGEGKAFYACVKDFLEKKVGNPGRFFWIKVWQMLICCSYLKKYYQASFSHYLKTKLAKFKNTDNISDHEFLSLTTDAWEKFKKIQRPWDELPGIGENTFDFIVGDTVEANFVKNSFKLDSANQYFFQTTGIAQVIGTAYRENVITFLKGLNLPYSLREINKGIYTFCSKTESHNFGFCRSFSKCSQCEVNDICEKNIS